MTAYNAFFVPISRLTISAPICFRSPAATKRPDSLVMGRGILASLAGLPTSGLPDNFMERLTPERVASHIERRRQAVRRWAEANPSFVTAFEKACQHWLATNARKRADKTRP